MHVDLGGYHVGDIEFTAAFDVTKDKVGKDLADAIWAHPNNTVKFADRQPKTGVRVSRGMTHDGLGKYVSEIVEKAPGETDDVVGILRETGTDVVVNFLPVGSRRSGTRADPRRGLRDGELHADSSGARRTGRSGSSRHRLPIIGDDIKSQAGATIFTGC